MTLTEDIKEDIKDIQSDIKDLKEQPYATEILHDYKMANFRMFIITILLIVGLFSSVIYTFYLLNDISYVDETTITQENNEGYNNYIGNDGDITYGETNNQES